MNIVFLCGALEPGRDGVGDYVRQLASELMVQGHQATCIALNDHYTQREIITTSKTHNETMTVLRLPSEWDATKRFTHAKQLIEKVAPDWVSLQFVPYAFHSKGLPFLLAEQLRRLIKNRKTHLMVHEGWVGNETGTSLRNRVVSVLQRAVIARIINAIKPNVIHTHLPLYSKRLAQLGWSALPLPLFSNIPVIKQSFIRDPTFRVGIFSQVDTEGYFLAFLAQLEEQLSLRNQQLEILLIGGNNLKMRAAGKRIEEVNNLRNKVRYTGFLEPIKTSAALQTCNLGLTPIPRHALGKSGSVAAFLSHGIPVAAPNVHIGYAADDIGFFSGDLCSSIVLSTRIEELEASHSVVQVGKNAIQLTTIAATFSQDLKRHAN